MPPAKTVRLRLVTKTWSESARQHRKRNALVALGTSVSGAPSAPATSFVTQEPNKRLEATRGNPLALKLNVKLRKPPDTYLQR
jgi:hypothetical protein